MKKRLLLSKIKDCWLTVGELKRWIEDYKLPDDAKIWYQRIEDVYFKKRGWKTRNMCNTLDDYVDQFVPVFSGVKYPKDKDLYLTAHY